MTHPLPEWAAHLLEALEIDPVNIDVDALHRIAGAVDQDAQTDALVVGFIAGYAAGLAQGSGMAEFGKAHAASVQFMTKSLIRE